MYLKLLHNDIVYNSEFLIKDYSLKEIYYNNLNQADNSCNLTIPYDVEIQNFINLYSDSNIKGQIIDGENIVWTGYLRKNYNFGKKQRNTELKIELVSPSYLLNSKTQEYFVLQNTNLGLAVQTLLSKAGFTSTVELTEEIGLFQIHPDTEIKKALTDLLFSYGYCFDFDNEGRFIVFPIFNKPETITQIFDGNNCIDEIKVSKKEQTYNATSVEWELVEKVENKLIFADTTGGNNESNSCSITIQPGEYLGEVDSVGTYYIQYDCAEGKILNVTEGTLTIESTNNSGLTYSYNNLGNQGELSIYNKSSSPITITKLVVYGDAFVVKSTNFAKSSTGTNFKDLKSDYIHNKTFAENLAKNYTDWLNYADYTVNLKSYTDFALGSFVRVTENGLGTIQGRIIEKIYNIKNEPIQYQIEAISEYVPAEVNSYTKKQSSLLVKGIMGKDGKDGIDGKDGESVSITSTAIDYQSSASGTEIPTGAWLNYIPAVSNGNFLWCRTTVNYSDGTKTESFSVSYIPTNGTNGKNGVDGKDGKDAVSIKTITEYYLASPSNSGVTTSTTGWTETIQTVSSSKKYLWNYEKITFTDNSTLITSPVIIGNYAANGTNGTNGKDGKGIKSITEHYLATTASSGVSTSTSGWTTTVQTMTATNKYLWNYETITYTDSSTSNTSPSIIGVYGDKGEQGATGATGATGPQGPQGAKGNTGVSMRNKGTWASGTAYVNNSSYIDVVYYASNGCSYSCIKSHTASSSILPTNTTYWSLIAEKGATGPKGDKGATGAQGAQGVRGAEYRGAFSSNPTSSLVNGDWYLKTGDGYCYYYTSSNSTWNKISSYSDYRYTQAMSDMINLSATLTSNTNFKTAVNAWVQNLVAGTALIEKLFAKSISVGNEIKSSNYSAGSSGFIISSDGNAEFNSGRFRGGLGTQKTIFSASWTPQSSPTSMSGYVPTKSGTAQKITLFLYSSLSYTSIPIATLENYYAVGKSVNSNVFSGEIYDRKLTISDGFISGLKITMSGLSLYTGETMSVTASIIDL